LEGPNREQIVTEKSDIWSFSLLIWELYTGLKPWTVPHVQFDLTNKEQLVQILVVDGIRPYQPNATSSIHVYIIHHKSMSHTV